MLERKPLVLNLIDGGINDVSHRRKSWFDNVTLYINMPKGELFLPDHLLRQCNDVNFVQGDSNSENAALGLRDGGNVRAPVPSVDLPRNSLGRRVTINVKKKRTSGTTHMKLKKGK